jgi:predicted ATPase
VAPQIQAIELARYRGFRDHQRPALSRLTLIYGENNSGKSALVRIPPLLAGSRTIGSPGLNLESPVLHRAGFREVQWRGSLPTEADPDLILGLHLSDGATWCWTFRWLDLKSIAVIQRVEIDAHGERAAFDLRHQTGQHLKDAEYNGPEGPIRLVFDGLLPRAGANTLMGRHRDGLNDALDGVAWLGAIRQGPTREGTPRGARGSLMGDGEGASALALAELPLRRAVSEWFRAHSRYDVEVEALGAEMQRLVLQPIAAAAYAVPFPDAGEGLQQVFPLVVALERLRREGGLIAVEEPESHLHPRLQRALAELVVAVLTEQPSASVMLETHSEVFLVAALRAAAGALPGAVRLHWVEAREDGAATLEDVPLDAEGRPTTPRLEQAFDTMGVMRRELLQERRGGAAQRRPHGG